MQCNMSLISIAYIQDMDENKPTKRVTIDICLKEVSDLKKMYGEEEACKMIGKKLVDVIS